MGKKNKNKVKKVSAKKQKYLKFKKEKSSNIDLSMPDLSEEQVLARRENDTRIDRFLKFNRNPPTKSLKEKRIKTK
jgi:hypothetical protein